MAVFRVPVSIKYTSLKSFSVSQSTLFDILVDKMAYILHPFSASPRAISSVNTGPAPSLKRNVIRIFFI